MLQPEVITALASLNTRAEIVEAWNVLRRKSQQLSAQKVVQFHPGQTVQFPDKRGLVIRGVVQRVNRTTVTVLAHDPDWGTATWRVAASLLTEATD
jgi:hypothetical protein